MAPTIPRMVTHQKEVYCRHGIWHLDNSQNEHRMHRMVTHHPKDGIHYPKYGHKPSQRWLPFFKRMVTNHAQNGPTPSPKVGHPTAQGRPPTATRMVTHYPKDMVAHCTPSPRWSPTKCRMITHHPQDGYHPPSPVWSTRLGV